MANLLISEKSYYEKLVEAETANEFRMVLIRLINRVVMKVKVPLEVRELFCEEVLEMYYERFGNVALPDSLANILSTYYMQDDTRGDLEGTNKFARCSKMEYSFASDKKEKRIRTEDLYKESPINLEVLEGNGYSRNNIASSLDMERASLRTDLLKAMAKADLTEMEKKVLELNLIYDYTMREIEVLPDMPSRSTLSRHLTSARKKIMQQI